MNYKKSFFLMGTNIEIIINSEINIEKEIYEAFGIFYSYELEFSRFLKNSTLSLLNQNKTLEVSSRFLDVFNLCKEIYNITNGFFNPLINLSNIGYSSNFEDNNFSKTSILNNLNMDEIKIEGNFINLLQDQNLDFGGIVKGYCVDIVAEYLLEKGCKDFIINAGGDIYTSGNNNGKKWIIGIDNPFIPDTLIGSIELENKSISTSGSYKRNWKIKGNNYHHIINPNNYSSCENEIISLSLISQKTYITDTYATACFNMGIEKSLKFLERNNIDSLIIGTDSKMYTSKGFNNYNFLIF
ncbi:MAG: FAD:protein FMN transferase [Candidatus Gracilibacteria bacterium]|nr:FAD:protein FMN transferase [Candidatus Gracilibacteria bacterium]